MSTALVQKLCEDIAISALSGGALTGLTFRHSDSGSPAKNEMVSVEAGAPTPRLGGERGYDVEVSIEVKTATATRNETLHSEVLARITDAGIVGAAALSAGLTTGDDLTILNEGIAGDRANTKTLRKRTITVPFIIAIH